MIELTDDGTLDTVLRCSECGEEMRYNFDPCGTEERAEELRTRHRSVRAQHAGVLTDDQIERSVEEELYDEFIDWAIEDATADHVCEVSSNDR